MEKLAKVSMFYYLILILSTLMATGKALLCKAIGTEENTKKDKMLLNLKAFFVAFLCSLLFILSKLPQLFKISSFSFILSIFFGLSVAITQVAQTKAMGNGPASTVTLIYSCGFLIPIFYGLVIWNEGVSLFQWLGVALLVFSLILCVGKREKRGALFAWLPFAVIAMLGSGANAIFQKTHQYSDFSDEISFFLVCCLFFSTVFTGIVCLLIKEEGKGEGAALDKKRLFVEKILFPTCLGACVGLLNFLNLTLSGKMPSVILFPVYNVGSMLLICILSSLIYKEKTTAVQKTGFCIGITAILIIGLF